jgi:ankyrin repeat protein
MNINGEREGYYPLHNAIDKNSLNMVKLLVEKGANLEVKNSNGQTPLQFAEQQNNDTIKKFLQTRQLKNEKR